MKIDIAIWAKDGEKYLTRVLKRIDEILPNEVVANKIFIDDHSTDDTIHIAKSFGWTIFNNERGGISEGANMALRQVKTEYFISIEQDIILSPYWFKIIVPQISGKNVAVVQGVRISSNKRLGKIDEYALENDNLSTSIDNTIYKTSVIRELGGFPYSRFATDFYLRMNVIKKGYLWIIDKNVISEHLRFGGLKQELKHQYGYGYEMFGLSKQIPNEGRRTAARTFYSPIRGIDVAIKKRCLSAVLHYPLIRWAYFFGFLKGFHSR